MSWRKYFTPVEQNTSGGFSPLSSASRAISKPGPANSNYSSYLPDVYVGSPNRVERYGQYNVMDLDSEVNAALDILAEFCTQTNKQNNTPFYIRFNGEATNSEVTITQKYLQQWCKLQEFETRMFRIVRNCFKYGDEIFIRDPETKKLYHVDPANVTRIIVNESEGKIPEQYILKNFNMNFRDMVATTPYETNGNITGGGSGYLTGGVRGMVGQPNQSMAGSRFMTETNEIAVDAEHVVHLSMSEGLDNNYPFGNSLLETVFKVYKQKELLEDAIIIYRVQRAPERRVFYIDTGNMPSHLAMQFVERVKTQIYQRRIPSKTGGSQNVIDSSYNPISIQEDFYFPQTCLSLDTFIPLLDGRTLTLQEIINEYEQGKINWTYGLDNKTHELEPAEIKWAGITRKNAQVVRVNLDNGESVIATPDHRFITRDGFEVEAQHLKIGESLMPLTLKDAYSGPNQKDKKYTKYISNNDGCKKFVHITISKKPIGKDTQVHHIDFNSRNNNPTNLQIMETDKHIELHRQAGSYSVKKQWSNKESREKLLLGIRNFYENAGEEIREIIKKRNSENAFKGWKTMNKETKFNVLENLKEHRAKNSKEKTINYDIEMFNEMKIAFDNGYDSISKLSKHLRKNENFQKAFKNANKNLKRDKNRSKNIQVTDSTLNKIVNIVGYKTFGDWKLDYTNQKSKFSNRQNHKVISIEWLDEKIDTGDITIESNSDSHWFGLAAGIYVHNSEGRGSKVETLPGGTNLGEIDDVRFFTNKLVRGLRIPSSYLPTGADDGNTQYNDGRVGTAYIQELRFNTYCERLQNMVIGCLDEEFKRYLLTKGVNIDTSMFNLKFQPPQNFASYRQAEIDNSRVPTYTQMSAIPYISNRFALKRFLGMTDEEIAENERLWREENDESIGSQPTNSAGEMRSAGITGAGIESDLGGIEDQGDMGAEPEMGGETAGPETATTADIAPTGANPNQNQPQG